ncbi:MAG: hypothetical protein U9R60_05320 [Bacteroidota bacterium]|nr:hypothetical protein [Bacteroidota bacterium]
MMKGKICTIMVPALLVLSGSPKSNHGIAASMSCRSAQIVFPG